MRDIWRPIYTMCQLHLFSSSWYFPLYFWLAIQIARSKAAAGFLLFCSRPRHWLPLAFLPLCGQRWNNPKSNTVLPTSSSLHWEQHHQTAVGWSAQRACRRTWYNYSFSLDALPVGDGACGWCCPQDVHGCNPFCWRGPRARFPSCVTKYALLQNTSFFLRCS